MSQTRLNENSEGCHELLGSRLSDRLKKAALNLEIETTIPVDRSTHPTQLSGNQERLWFAQQLAPEDPVYNRLVSRRIIGILRLGMFSDALQSVVARHEILRTSFHQSEGLPKARIHEEISLRIEEMDLSAENDEALKLHMATRHVQDTAKKCFDLSAVPLFRFLLIRLSPEEHLFTAIFHHILFDAKSESVFVRDLTEFYESRVQERKPCLPTLRMQYGDVARWLKSVEKEKDWSQARRFWRETMSGFPLALELPGDALRLKTEISSGGIQSFLLSSRTETRLNQLLKNHRATKFMVLLSVFQVLLFRLTQSEKFPLGIFTYGRPDKETDELVGPFSNLIPFPATVGPRVTFRELLEQTAIKLPEHLDHQHIPIRELAEALHEKGVSRGRLPFNLAFNYEINKERTPADGSLEISAWKMDPGLSNLDLTVEVIEENGALEFEFNYSAGKFLPETIRALGGSFLHMMDELIGQPDAPISSLAWMDEASTQEVIRQGNPDCSGYSPHRDLPAWIEMVTSQSPRAVAIDLGQEQLSYQQMAAKVDSLSAWFIRQGMAQGEFVGLIADRSPDAIMAILALMKSGITYVPLDPDHPTDRIEYILKDCDIHLVLNTLDGLPETFQRIFKGGDHTFIALDWNAIDSHEAPATFPDIPSSQPAYVLYTSGSSGRPKGVLIPRVNILRFLEGVSPVIRLKPGDRMMFCTTISFDISILEMFLPLVSGATVVPTPSRILKGGRELQEWIRGQRINAVQLAPTAWRILCETPRDGDLLDIAISGAEALDLKLAQSLTERTRRLINAYGPTEATVWACYQEVSREELADLQGGLSVPIGRPAKTVQALVLDPFGHPLPPRIPGELFLGGSQLAMGYLNRDDLTSERFRKNPFGTGRIYQTGDRVRWRSHADLEFINRLDNQLQIRGIRVEPAEIESVLLQLPGIKECAVIPYCPNEGDLCLIAWFVTSEPLPPSPDTILVFLRERLPASMIPRVLNRLDALPAHIPHVSEEFWKLKQDWLNRFRVLPEWSPVSLS